MSVHEHGDVGGHFDPRHGCVGTRLSSQLPTFRKGVLHRVFPKYPLAVSGEAVAALWEDDKKALSDM